VNELSREDAEKLVASIGIPPRPAVVLAVMDEKSKDEPNLALIGQAISRDVGVAAALLKTVNSPLYGLRNPVSSIAQAVNLLGLNQVSTLVNSLALKTTLNTQGIERFWDQSARIAMLSAWLAGRLRLDRDSAQLFGLFRDAGIPLLMRRFPDYKDTLRIANEDSARVFTEIEDERHGMNHAVVGSIVARNWALSDALRTAILRHHDISLFTGADDRAAQQLVALTHLAGQIENRTLRQTDDSEWARFQESVMTTLMLGEDDVAELIDEAGSLLLESGM
jgi:HD-like signal output (HDOD) protein